ncbi:glycine zipper 2TM domain-containing protein [Blastomonas aquatica]|uniref:17 kDa surface antigen n=1 Tax=Blastomonas aquatica TaxID=1510276 RepID=A0ABQ1J3R3_9SPHN|nr:glycine zipper 2TM domain-containing protein [Blastomonas aquatica]GGB57129.1 hypothetical protein GCM10010833_09800 [Blastomonas aquatica]
MLNLALASAAAFLSPAPAPATTLAFPTSFHTQEAADFQRRDERRAYNQGRRDARRNARYEGRYWRGNDGRYRCQRSNGTTGLLVGAGVGALIGDQVAGRGDKTLGAVVGGLGGAAAGRAIDRSRVSCR